ncbi:hypothetical protein SNEBB_001463 [Seison nebaliae]|nr:hypothetical protein SNEBB_001463 [Seison nebaliae]
MSTMKLSQEAFDKTVLERMNDFDISREEAINEVVKEYELMKIDISQVSTSTEKPRIIEKFEEIIKKQNCIKKEELNKLLVEILEENYDSKLVGMINNLNMVQILVNKLKEEFEDCFVNLLKILAKLIRNNGDKLTERSFNIMFDLLEKYLELIGKKLNGLDESEMLKISSILQVLKNSCVFCEPNREKVMKKKSLVVSDVLQKLIMSKTINTSYQNTTINYCDLLKTLVTDDDIREVCGKATSNAKEIFEEKEFINNFTVLHQIYVDNLPVSLCMMQFITFFCVREEINQLFYNLKFVENFTKLIEKDAYKSVLLLYRYMKLLTAITLSKKVGRDLINDGMYKHFVPIFSSGNLIKNDKLINTTFIVLRALMRISNDYCEFAQYNMLPLIMKITQMHESNNKLIFNVMCLLLTNMKHESFKSDLVRMDWIEQLKLLSINPNLDQKTTDNIDKILIQLVDMKKETEAK